MTPSAARALQARLSPTYDEQLEFDLLTADWGAEVVLPANGPYAISVSGALSLSLAVRGPEATYIILHKALILARMKSIDLLQADWVRHFAPSIVEELLQTFITAPVARRLVPLDLKDLSLDGI